MALQISPKGLISFGKLPVDASQERQYVAPTLTAGGRTYGLKFVVPEIGVF